jgi:flavin-dependent dehydrogenase
MKETEILIIGGGPAGSACARELVHAGKDVLILDKAEFPRSKLCAGWITPKVFRLLKTKPQDFPGGLLTFRKLYFHFGNHQIAVPTRQYSVRRYEFDHWLLQESEAPVENHFVKQIRKEKGRYIIDETYTARYLIGAGGSNDPVARTFLSGNTAQRNPARIVALETEFLYPYSDNRCHLWFYENGLSGYSWYVPKANGFINIGIGAKQADLKNKGQSIHEHWQFFTEKLAHLNLITGQSLRPRGHHYYLRTPNLIPQKEQAYIIGDALGLATIDMGEGIASSIQSGILAAQAILQGKPFTLSGIRRFSFPGILFPF